MLEQRSLTTIDVWRGGNIEGGGGRVSIYYVESMSRPREHSGVVRIFPPGVGPTQTAYDEIHNLGEKGASVYGTVYGLNESVELFHSGTVLTGNSGPEITYNGTIIPQTSANTLWSSSL